VRLLFTLDEGMAITEGSVPGVVAPVALVGIAEKGYLTLELTARGEGGHSSTPPRSGAIGRLARAIQRLEENPLPARIDGPSAALLDATAPHMPWLQRLVLGNRWLLGPLVESQLAGHPASNAMIRTTTAVTMLRAGVKENVLPPEAVATANFRILPGDATAEVVERVRAIVDDPEVAVEVVRADEASRVSDAGSPAYALVADAIRAVAPEAIVAPALVLGGTDTKHYGRLAENSFRFTAFRVGPGDLARMHGVNERVGVANFENEVVRFYEALLERADAALPGD
jgi:carboxypeptidase PM20D1